MSKKIIFSIIAVMLVIGIFISVSMSRYTSGKTGGGVGFKVAKPICRVVADNQINIANYGNQNTLNFSVNNFDVSNKKSETAMNYNIVIKVNQANAPGTSGSFTYTSTHKGTYFACFPRNSKYGMLLQGNSSTIRSYCIFYILSCLFS